MTVTIVALPLLVWRVMAWPLQSWRDRCFHGDLKGLSKVGRARFQMDSEYAAGTVSVEPEWSDAQSIYPVLLQTAAELFRKR